MGYNGMCFYQDCNFNCCSLYGTCATTSLECYYYYTDVGMIAGSVVGSVVALIVIISVACYCYRRKQQQLIMERLNAQRQSLPGYNNSLSYSAPQSMNSFGQPAAQQYGQTPYAKPSYNDAFNAQLYGGQSPIVIL